MPGARRAAYYCFEADPLINVIFSRIVNRTAGLYCMAVIMKVIWSHGQEAGPWGAKSSSLAQTAEDMGFEFLTIDYRSLPDPADRVEMLVQKCSMIKEPVILAGSSMGGFVSVLAAGKVRTPGLFLLAPALVFPKTAEPDFFPAQVRISIVHGWRDEIIPPEISIEFAGKHRACLHLIDGDHRLKENLRELNVFFRLFLSRAGGV